MASEPATAASDMPESVFPAIPGEATVAMDADDPRWQPTTAACPYCGLTDHTGREHFQFVIALSEGAEDDE